MEIRRRLNVLMASRHAIYGGQLMPILQVTRAIVPPTLRGKWREGGDGKETKVM